MCACQRFVGRRCDPSINRGKFGGMPPLANLNPFTCGGGPALFLWYHTCLCHKPWYHRNKPRGSANFRLGSKPKRTGIQMTQADSVHSTPPLNSSASQELQLPSRDRAESADSLTNMKTKATSGPTPTRSAAKGRHYQLRATIAQAVESIIRKVDA
jgi:hypothetical protein